MTDHINIVCQASKVRGYLAWGKVGPILTMCPVSEPGDVFFRYAATEKEARELVKADILKAHGYD